MTVIDEPEVITRVHRSTIVQTDGVGGEEALHLERMRAASLTMGPTSYFCLESAALVHGLPLWSPHLDKVHVVLTAGGHGNETRWIHRYRSPKRSPSIAVIDGLPVTSLERTAADLMRRLRFGPALAVADAALRGGASRLVLTEEVRTGRGCRHAGEAVRRADPRSESPYESLARALFLQHDLPLPELQAEFADAWGFVGRTDFYWPRHRLIGEFDGAVKYSALLQPGQTLEDVLAAQSARQGRLEAMGYRVVRWGSADLHDELAFVAGLSPLLGHRRVEHALPPEALDHRRVPGERRARRRTPWA